MNQIEPNIRLPAGFHLVGHVALVELNSELVHLSERIGDLILQFDHRVESVAVKSQPTEGVFRQPGYRLVAGKMDTHTVHTENNIRFKLDPLRITFSGGNKAERIRMASIANVGEKVVDMFSCVGQFALPIALHSDSFVTAIELNPEAYSYLIENIRLNNLTHRVSAINGDCRVVHPLNHADRIIMGYLHDTISFLPHALETLVESGGTIHMHEATPKVDIGNYCNTINTVCKSHDYVARTKVRVVKTYSPNVNHYVFDIVLHEK